MEQNEMQQQNMSDDADRERASHQSEIEASYQQALQDVAGHWFTQGGKWQFHDDHMLPDPTSADHLIANILSAVRASLAAKEELNGPK